MKLKTKAEFEKLAQGLTYRRCDLSAEVLYVEAVGASYFRDSTRQRCIVRKDGKLYLSDYD